MIENGSITIVEPTTIVVGQHELLPNTSGQSVQIFVTGGTLVEGLDFYAQVGDGGPERTQLGLTAGGDGPSITTVDLKTATIFAGTAATQSPPSGIPQIISSSILINEEEDAIGADGLLATLTVDTTGFFGGSWDLRLSQVLPEFGGLNAAFIGTAVQISNGSLTIGRGSVENRQVFYNNSVFDGEDAAANAADDSAIAIDKAALRPGETATFVNYTNYSRGINGIMVDVNAMGFITAEDFQFRVGNGNQTGTWSAAPAPLSVTTRAGAGRNGSDRITIVWADDAIRGQWLQVTLLANTNTQLLANDVFYFGNAVGDIGNSTLDALVTATDEIQIRNNPRSFVAPATVDSRHDLNRDGFVNAADQILARSNATSVDGLQLIKPVASTLMASAQSSNSANLDAQADDLGLAAFGLAVDRSQRTLTSSIAAATSGVERASGIALPESKRIADPDAAGVDLLFSGVGQDEDADQLPDELFEADLLELLACES